MGDQPVGRDHGLHHPGWIHVRTQEVGGRAEREGCALGQHLDPGAAPGAQVGGVLGAGEVHATPQADAVGPDLPAGHPGRPGPDQV